MTTFTRPFVGTLYRPFLRVLLYLIVFGTFFAIFLPSAYVPPLLNRLAHLPDPLTHKHRPGPVHPPTFAPPQSRPHRHRIKVQRPVRRPDDSDLQNGDVWAQRADAVRDAFLQAYNSYVTHAAPHDELQPLSRTPVDKCVHFTFVRGPRPAALVQRSN
jgi:hypothetical protein